MRHPLVFAVAVAVLFTMTMAGAAQQPTSASEVATKAWAMRVYAHIARFRLHPDGRRGLPCALSREGLAVVDFKIDRAGRVVDTRIVASSKHRVLDRDAMDIVKRASPVPPPPRELTSPKLQFRIPIKYMADCRAVMGNE